MLPADAVLVHIGPHKTGTTAIQSVLAGARSSLPEYGVQYPGKLSAHHDEAKALRQYGGGWVNDHEKPPDPAVWTALMRTIGETPGRVVISSEIFAEADADARARLVRDIGAERVHILAAARQPAGLAVSTWQQVLRKGHPLTFDDWLERIYRPSDHRAEPGQQPGFWERTDPVALSRRWIDVVGPDRFTLVALDERDRRLLPATFEQLLGLPDGLLADRKPAQSNRGLTAVEAALVREIIASVDSRLSWTEYTRVMRKGVIRRLMEVRQPGPDEAKVTLPPWAVEQAVTGAERIIAGLRELGVNVVGDLDSLRPAVPVSAETAPAPITGVPLDVAAEAVLGAIAAGVGGHWSLDSQPGRPARPSRRGSPRRAAQPPAQARDPLDDMSARELAAVLARRVRARLRRR